MRTWTYRLGACALAVAVAGLVAWRDQVFTEYVPSPKRTFLAFQNVLRGTPRAAEDRFRVVLCWLDNDPGGDNTSNVAQAFTSVEGIALEHSAQIVAASGAADGWREAMQNEARSVLNEWNADLAVVGLVKRPGEALSLWFVPRSGEGSLGRGDEPYELENATLGPDFHDDFRTRAHRSGAGGSSPAR